MSKKSSKAARPAQAAGIGHNSGLVIEKLTTEYRTFRRKNIFDEGDLLIKIKNACEKYGDWGKWLKDEYLSHGFDKYRGGSRDTADRHILAARFAATFRLVRQLRVPARVIYELASAYFADEPADSDHYSAKDVEVAIPALAKADKASEAALTEKECWEAINQGLLQAKWGSLPPATLQALDSIPADAPWAEAAIADLKKRRPKTADAAEQIVTAHHRVHLEKLWDAKLPDGLNDTSLDLLEAVPEERRAEIAAKLNPDQPLPADPEELHKLVVALVESNGAAQPVEPPSPSPPSPSPPRPSPPSPEPEPIGKREAKRLAEEKRDNALTAVAEAFAKEMITKDRAMASKLYDLQMCRSISAKEAFEEALSNEFMGRHESYEDAVRAAEKRLLSTSAPKNSSDGNDVDPVATGVARMALNAAADDPKRWKDSA